MHFSNYPRRTILTCFVLAAFSAIPALGDVVVLTNGDRLSGKVAKKDGDMLTFKSDLAGEVKLKWENVTSVNTDEPVTVVLPGGDAVKGKLATAADRKLEVETESGKREAAITEVEALRDALEQTRYERLLRPPLYDLWAGSIDLNLASASGNSQTTVFTTNMSAARITKTSKIRLYFNQIYSQGLVANTNIKTTTARAIRGGWSADRSLSKRWFLTGFNDYEYDSFQNLDLRFVVGGGAGYSVFKGERAHLDLQAGANYNRERFTSPVENPVPGLPPQLIRNSGEVYFGDDLIWRVTRLSSLNQKLKVFNNLTRTGEVRGNFDLGIDTKLSRWLAWQVSFSNRYLSNPALGRRTNDVLVSSGIRLSFAQFQ